MIRRIKIVMADMVEWYNDYNNLTTHHIMLSNCYKREDWFARSIDIMHDKDKDILMIGVNT